jgi:hypothetical protein
MSTRRRCAALAIVAVAVTSACDSSSAKKGGASAAGHSATPSAKAPAGTPVDPATISARITKGLAAVGSAHLEVAIDADGQPIDVSGDEALQAGKVRAVRASTDSVTGSGPVELVVAGGKTYAKLPKKFNPTSKPYVLVSANSKNAKIRALASTVDFALGAVSLDLVASLTGAAKSARLIGPTTVGGAPATRYALTVVTGRLPADFPARSLLVASGLKELPADLYLDSAGRPVQVSQAVKVEGHGISVKVAVSKYDQPVTIVAPPASQVATG